MRVIGTRLRQAIAERDRGRTVARVLRVDLPQHQTAAFDTGQVTVVVAAVELLSRVRIALVRLADDAAPGVVRLRARVGAVGQGLRGLAWAADRVIGVHAAVILDGPAQGVRFGQLALAVGGRVEHPVTLQVRPEARRQAVQVIVLEMGLLAQRAGRLEADALFRARLAQDAAERIDRVRDLSQVRIEHLDLASQAVVLDAHHVLVRVGRLDQAAERFVLEGEYGTKAGRSARITTS